VAALSALNADPRGDAVTAVIGDPMLSGRVGVSAPNFSEAGWGTSLTVSEVLALLGLHSGFGFDDGHNGRGYAFADQNSEPERDDERGRDAGSGGGSATIDKGATISVSDSSISGAGTDVKLDEFLSYAGSFSVGADDTFVLSGGDLLLSRAASFAGGTVDGSNFLYTEGMAAVSDLTIGGTVEWENTKAVTQSGGTVTIGDSIGDKAILNNELLGTYDIADDSGIARGNSTASDIVNAGLFEKTGGTGASTIVPNVTNNGTIEVTSGTLAFTGRILGTDRTPSRAFPSCSLTRVFRRAKRFTSPAAAANSNCTAQQCSPARSGASTRQEPDRTTRSRSPSPGSTPASPRTPGARRGRWGSLTAQARSASRSSAITTRLTSLRTPF
jgi:hypothetical protein